ncbi:MAG: hypothetical protein ACLUIX_05615 [Oscillospiraceae bacterium]
MNAGAYGGEMRQVVTEVTALAAEGVRRFTAEEAAFGYRRGLSGYGGGGAGRQTAPDPR